MPAIPQASKPVSLKGIFTVSLLVAPAAALSHHSRAEFIQSQIDEIEGEITEVIWRNPHYLLFVEDDAGVTFEFEGADVVSLRRRGIERDTVTVGQRVIVAGSPSNRRENALDLLQILLPDGSEVMFSGRATPRWSDIQPDATARVTTTQSADTEDSFDSADGIFRTWARTQHNRPALADLPLTEAALAAHAEFDPLANDPVMQCIPPGMPRAITFAGPHPIAFVDNGDAIHLEMEYFNIVRTIHMDVNDSAAPAEHSPLGYSVGRRDGDDLIVTTTHISWPQFDLYWQGPTANSESIMGFPQSTSVEIVERFNLRDNGRELGYDISATDPETFTEPLALTDYLVWRWQPGTSIEPFECIVSE